MVDRFRRQEPGLTIAEWREVLGDEYWNAYTTLLLVEDDAGQRLHPGNEYARGGELFFGSVNAHIKSGTRTVNTTMDCGCVPTAVMASEIDRRYSVMHWLEGMALWVNLMEVDEKYRN
jgi:hypothetical protein